MFEGLNNTQGPILNNRPNKLLLTLDEASEALSVSRAMISKLVRTGRLRATRIGRCVRISQAEVLRLCIGDQAEGVDSNA